MFPVPLDKESSAPMGGEAPGESQGAGSSASGQPPDSAALDDDASRAAVAFKVRSLSRPPIPLTLAPPSLAFCQHVNCLHNTVNHAQAAACTFAFKKSEACERFVIPGL